MTGRGPALLVASVVGSAMVCVGGLLGLAGAASACTPHIAPTAAAPNTPTTPASVPGYDREQLTNAATIVSAGAGRGIPRRGPIIAVATALQESSLRNLGHLGENNDHDSLGLFQQRPSQGWGTPDQVMDPVYASNRFYDKLLTIPHWQQLPLTEAAQAVQVSATPRAYAKWEADATTLVARIIGAYSDCNTGYGMSGAGMPLPAGFTLPPDTPLPVAVAIWWALRQLGTPYAFGGDCTDPHSGIPARQCDCSSLIQQAYHAGEISVPRVTDDQQHAGTAITRLADVLPGDLIFIPGAEGTMSDPGHVGLYIGQGMLVNAPHTGDVVKIVNVSSWFPIAKLRRIVPWQARGPYSRTGIDRRHQGSVG
jgi:cell wall-associated NlpC family hydrolase